MLSAGLIVSFTRSAHESGKVRQHVRSGTFSPPTLASMRAARLARRLQRRARLASHRSRCQHVPGRTGTACTGRCPRRDLRRSLDARPSDRATNPFRCIPYRAGHPLGVTPRVGSCHMQRACSVPFYPWPVRVNRRSAPGRIRTYRLPYGACRMGCPSTSAILLGAATNILTAIVALFPALGGSVVGFGSGIGCLLPTVGVGFHPSLPLLTLGAFPSLALIEPTGVQLRCVALRLPILTACALRGLGCHSNPRLHFPFGRYRSR